MASEIKGVHGKIIVRPISTVLFAVFFGGAVWLVILLLIDAGNGATVHEPPIAISGNWIVKTIDVGARGSIAVPEKIHVSFAIDEAQRTIEAGGAGAAFDCRFSRDLNDLTLSNCLASGNVPIEEPAPIYPAIRKAFELAFRQTTLSVAPNDRNGLTIRMGEVTFVTTRSH